MVRRGRWGPRRVLHATAVVVAVAAGALYVVVPITVAVIATHRAPADPVRPNLGRPAQAVTLTTRDGVHLAGRYVP